ncbi:MAG: hypothetical protein ABJL44_18925 [Algibacter sp.]
MKAVFSYILFFTLAIRPLYNMGYVAYYALNIDYVIETYCVNKEKPEFQCNGKCHLATQLAVNTSNSSTDSYLSSLFEVFVPVYFQEYKRCTLLNTNVFSKDNNWNYSKSLKLLFLDRLDRPPKV